MSATPHDRTCRADGRLWAKLDALAADAGQANPFYHPALLGPALSFLDPDKAVRLLTVAQGGHLIAALPVVVSKRHGRLPIANTTNWVHPHCFLGSPLLRSGAEKAGWAGLLAQLDDADWSGQFLHLTTQAQDGPAMEGLMALCTEQVRPLCALVRHDRAMLASPLSASEYWDSQIRPKKRKELRRLVNRLEELGAVIHSVLDDPAHLDAWCDTFLALEASGWKGSNGTAIACDAGTTSYFRQAMANACRANMLDMLRIDVDGHAIAMLVNFRHGEGGFSYKIAIDETYGRFSPGVLVEMDNLHRVLDGGSVAWMDSCAEPGHPLIDGLWAERRTIAQYRIALRGRGVRALTRTTFYTLAGTIEAGRRLVRRKESQ